MTQQVWVELVSHIPDPFPPQISNWDFEIGGETELVWLHKTRVEWGDCWVSVFRDLSLGYRQVS